MLGQLGEVVEQLGGALDITACLPKRRTTVTGFQLGEAIRVRFQKFRDSTHPSGAFRGCEADPAPVVVRSGGRTGGAIDVRLLTEGHLGKRFSAGGFDRGETTSGQRGNLAAVDEVIGDQLGHAGLLMW